MIKKKTNNMEGLKMKKIEIDLRSEQSMKQAEKKKTRLENKGYTLTMEDIGFVRAVLFFEKV